ncbi:MAG: hypothetical protein ACO1OB_34800 [Archangium sp.]
MKRIILSCLMALALLSTSCANQTSPIDFEKFYPLGPTCDVGEFVDNFFVANGSLDVAWGNPVYVVAFQLIGSEGFIQPGLTVGDNVLERPNRNEPLVRQIVINYRPSRPLGITPREYVVPYTGITRGNLQGVLQLLSPEVSQALSDTLSPTNDFSDVIDLNIDIRFEGEMTGTHTAISSATMTFPLRVYRSAPPPGFSCANGPRRYSVDAVTGAPSCLYAGQTFGQIRRAPGPFDAATDCCPAAGSPEC